MCSKHVEAWNKTYLKQILFIKLVKYWDKYTEKHGQQNVESEKRTEGLLVLLQSVFGHSDISLTPESNTAVIMKISFLTEVTI